MNGGGNKITNYLDLRQQPKTFLEGDWDKVIKGHLSILKSKGYDYCHLIINKNNQTDFVELLKKISFKYQYGGYIGEFSSDFSLIPSNGEVYIIKL